MIYLNSSCGQVIMISHQPVENQADAYLLFVNKITNKEIRINVPQDVSTGPALHVFPIGPIAEYGFEIGEYTYQLVSNGVIYETGLMVYGDYNRRLVDEYEPNKKIIKQYGSN